MLCAEQTIYAFVTAESNMSMARAQLMVSVGFLAKGWPQVATYFQRHFITPFYACSASAPPTLLTLALPTLSSTPIALSAECTEGSAELVEVLLDTTAITMFYSHEGMRSKHRVTDASERVSS